MKKFSNVLNFSIWDKSAIALSIAILILASMTSYFPDLESLTVWSLNIWDTLFVEKNPFMFYAYTAQNIHGAGHSLMGCDILVCIPWAIWNLPLWLIQHFCHLSVLEHPLMLFYSKAFLLFLVIGCYFELNKIGELLVKNNKKHVSLCSFLFVTSFFTLSSVGYFGQNDIMIVYITMLAIRFLLCEKWKTFLFLSALSIAFEPFFAFSYLAIIFYKEKRFHYILLYIISGFSLFFLQKALFWNAPMYQESLASGPTVALLYLMLENQISVTPYTIALFPFSLIVLYLLSYLDDDNTTNKQKILYYNLAGFCCYFLFVRVESYRPLYLFAFIYLLIIIKPTYFRINLILESIATFSIMLLHFFNDTFFFNAYWLILPNRNENSTLLLRDALDEIPTLPANIFSTSYLICIITLLIINHPRFNINNSVLTMKTERYLLLLRNLIITLPYILTVILQYI